jgi:5-deoxy-glucuronate isomerase
MEIRQEQPFNYGYNSITELNGKHSDMLMDFGILKMKDAQVEVDTQPLEKAYLLLFGKVQFNWDDQEVVVERDNCFDTNPYCLHVPPTTDVKVACLDQDTEIAVFRTDNEESFEPKLYNPDEVRSEQRGKGTMKEASTRTVRTIFDKENTSKANLVLGEVIGYPGKWSSYPPHHHPQPEIYFYKFNPSNGYGFSELGDDVIKLEENITVKVLPGMTHPQVTAPGYAMYYLWAIRHLDDEPYITPTFVEEHTWVQEEDAVIWPDKE